MCNTTASYLNKSSRWVETPGLLFKGVSFGKNTYVFSQVYESQLLIRNESLILPTVTLQMDVKRTSSSDDYYTNEDILPSITLFEAKVEGQPVPEWAQLTHYSTSQQYISVNYVNYYYLRWENGNILYRVCIQESFPMVNNYLKMFLLQADEHRIITNLNL